MFQDSHQCIGADFHQWLKQNENNLPEPKSVIEQLLKN